MNTELHSEEYWESQGLGIAGRQLVTGERWARPGDLWIAKSGRRAIVYLEFDTDKCDRGDRFYRKIPVAKQWSDVIHLDKLPDGITIDAAARKKMPVCTGVLDYFPDALLAVAYCSLVGNEQHNKGQPLHWAKDKSTDHADCLVRHLLQRGTIDTDGVSHTVKVAWRALALLQTELESANNRSLPDNSP